MSKIKNKINNLMEKPNFNILLLDLSNELNLGDKVISKCVRYLVQEISRKHGDFNINIVNIDMREETNKIIPDMDLIIFVGGGLIKYKYQKFYQYIPKIVHKAYLFNVPVFFNAVGIEGYDANDAKCQKLKAFINIDNVHLISTRDDFTTLKSKYILNRKISIESVCDPAHWTKEAYGVTRKESSIVGIGIIRSAIFQVYGVNISDEEYITVMTQLLFELDKRGVKWKLFTNGLPEDYETLTLITKRYGADVETIAYPSAKEDIELVEQISTFSAIISSRLHSHIIAYSLGIPSLGLVWNEKLNMFGEQIHYSNHFINQDSFSVEAIINAYEELDEYTDEDHKIQEEYKQTDYTSLEYHIGKVIDASPYKCSLMRKKIYLYGTKANLKDKKFNKSLLKRISGIVSDDANIIGTQYMNHCVKDCRDVKKRDGFIIVMNGQDYANIKYKLEDMGFVEGKHFISHLKYDRYPKKRFYLYRKSMIETQEN